MMSKSDYRKARAQAKARGKQAGAKLGKSIYRARVTTKQSVVLAADFSVSCFRETRKHA